MCAKILMPRIVSAAVLCTLALGTLRVLKAGTPRIIKKTPTILTNTLLRGAEGVFGARRASGKTHTGVDIVANQLSVDKEVYRVRAVGDGVVAYALFNGEDPDEGYGYTVVLDHGDGTYTLYAHLATLASAGVVKVGTTMNAGEVLGYMADPANNEMSSGNVLGPSVPVYARIQLHFEEIQAPAGRRSSGGIKAIKEGATILDPTQDLTANGYKPEPAKPGGRAVGVLPELDH
jgi:murein DD-endopeptidase MepM/ murein hydrolase activator NlpD